MRVVSRLELHDAPTGAGTVVGAGGALAVCASCMRTKSSSLVRCLGSTMCLCDATLQGQRPLCDFSLQSSVFCVASSIVVFARRHPSSNARPPSLPLHYRQLTLAVARKSALASTCRV
jgi:hypothetical protein